MASIQLGEHARTQLETCVHCGLCLPACPTYRELGDEADSPRGRIHLIRSVVEGRVALDNSFIEHMYLCLDCRACESACPSGVKYGRLVETARAEIESQIERPRWLRALRWLFFRQIFPHPRRLAWMAALLRLAQQRGWTEQGVRLIQRVPWLKERFGHLTQMAPMLPPVAASPSRSRIAPITPAQGPAFEPAPHGRAAFFAGCVMDAVLGDTNCATVQTLSQAGVEVVTPAAQRCCGALHLHGGDAPAAKDLARRNIDAFLATDAPYIVVNAAGCGAMLKEYRHLLEDDPAYREKAELFSSRVRDYTEFLGNLPQVPAARPFPRRVVYQDACHLAHGQGVRRQPRQLLRAIPGLELVEMAEPDTCCGSAGIYNLTQPEMSMALLDRKMENVRRAGADVLITANPGCLMQLRLGVQRAGLNVQVMHIADLLDACWEAPAVSTATAGSESRAGALDRKGVTAS